MLSPESMLSPKTPKKAGLICVVVCQCPASGSDVERATRLARCMLERRQLSRMSETLPETLPVRLLNVYIRSEYMETLPVRLLNVYIRSEYMETLPVRLLNVYIRSEYMYVSRYVCLSVCMSLMYVCLLY